MQRYRWPEVLGTPEPEDLDCLEGLENQALALVMVVPAEARETATPKGDAQEVATPRLLEARTEVRLPTNYCPTIGSRSRRTIDYARRTTTLDGGRC